MGNGVEQTRRHWDLEKDVLIAVEQAIGRMDLLYSGQKLVPEGLGSR